MEPFSAEKRAAQRGKLETALNLVGTIRASSGYQLRRPADRDGFGHQAVGTIPLL